MNSEEHKIEAERLVKLASISNEPDTILLLRAAQVHATLATIPDIECNTVFHGFKTEGEFEAWRNGTG